VNGQPIRLPAQSSADSDKLIQFWLQAANDGWGFRWAILLSNESDIFIGHLGFNQLGEHAEIAYHMNPDYWGHGYMQEAAAEAIGWVKSRGTKQIEAFVDPKNHKSVRLTENLGLRSTSTYAEGAQKFERAF